MDDFTVRKVREPFASHVGFYPSNRLELVALLDHLLASVKKIDVEGDIVGALVPHAGYQYSGKVAASVYKQLVGKEFELVIIFGPPHRVYRQEPTFDSHDFYVTPLGRVAVDQDFIGELISESPLFSISRQPHIQEHSIEVQLPFLQHVLKGGFKIAPAVVGDLTFEQLEKAADILSSKLKHRNALILASSDLSHYFPYEQAVELDRATMEAVAKFDPELLYKRIMMSDTELCGGFGVVLTMLTLRKLGADRAIELMYVNSGDIIGTSEAKSSVVGYGSAIFINRRKTIKLISENWFDKAEQTELLNLARSTLKKYLTEGILEDYVPVHEKLYEKRGAFVTLKDRSGKLRGCIGHIQADKPVYRVVQEMTVAAATQDPRFPPVTPDEVPNLTIEISVLSPLERIESARDIEIGRHGLYVKKGIASGLLLPQVAIEWGFDRDEFLRQTLFKAGLEPADLRSPDLEIYRFSAQVFSEEEIEKK